MGASFFYWFQGVNLLLDDQNFKRGGDIKMREDQISMVQGLHVFSAWRVSVSLLKLSFKTHFSFCM